MGGVSGINLLIAVIATTVLLGIARSAWFRQRELFFWVALTVLIVAVFWFTPYWWLAALILLASLSLLAALSVAPLFSVDDDMQ